MCWVCQTQQVIYFLTKFIYSFLKFHAILGVADFFLSATAYLHPATISKIDYLSERRNPSHLTFTQ